MKPPTRSARALALASLVAGAALAVPVAGVAAQAAPPRALSPAERARADSGRPPYTPADVRFLSGMIGHHGQAVVMAGWAPSHGASASIRTLAERIVVAQRDEIAFMQRWLRERRLPVPDPAPSGAMAGMDHMEHMEHGAAAERMPGMLTPEQLAQLDAARGAEFDRLFLTFMIQHHEGALTMVEQLFASPGAGQDDAVFKFASDVSADQSTEIDRMQTMLDALGGHRSM
jgi:uncharacterized protein (DUF305 family)